MIRLGPFIESLDHHGFNFYAGVPCSQFSGPIAVLTGRGQYVPAANEGTALSIAAGASAAGKRPAVFAQNSGLGNMVNPLTSLVLTYDIPVLVFMSLRGWPDGSTDEPQHQVMGATTHRILDVLGVPHWTLPATADDLDRPLALAVTAMERGKPTFVLVERGAIGSGDPQPLDGPPAGRGCLSRREAVQTVTESFPTALFVSTTGYVSRELFSLLDSERCFYMQGSMGHASAFGLGVTGSTGARVVVLDGDGAALMHLGAMSTIGGAAAPGLVHVILDNGAYESTGGQATTSETTSFTAVAKAVGYRSAVQCRNRREVVLASETATGADGPHLIVISIQPRGGPPPPRATTTVPAPVILSRFAGASRTA